MIGDHMGTRRQSTLRLLAIGYVIALLTARGPLTPAHADEAKNAPSARCGNGILEAGETCASCPTDCAIRPCVVSKPARTVSIRFVAPSDQDISGVTVLLGYRGELVSLPGHGADNSVRTRLTETPEKAIVAVNDLDYAARVVVGRWQPIPSGKLFAFQFDRCDGAAPSTAADFACTVEACATVFGRTEGCSCTAAVE
jgi:hypothetical protein